MRHSFECLRSFLAGGQDLAEAASYESDLPGAVGAPETSGALRT
jgi:hypothetical protein